MRDTTNSADLIDSRDIIDRIAALTDEDAAVDEEYEGELAALQALADEGESLDDWTYGIALIRDSYFEEYARELADDIGAVNRDGGWPTYCIDWEWAARELRMDYSAIDFDGVTYWGR